MYWQLPLLGNWPVHLLCSLCDWSRRPQKVTEEAFPLQAAAGSSELLGKDLQDSAYLCSWGLPPSYPLPARVVSCFVLTPWSLCLKICPYFSLHKHFSNKPFLSSAYSWITILSFPFHFHPNSWKKQSILTQPLLPLCEALQAISLSKSPSLNLVTISLG